jgi:Uma2 family endonuclease
MSTATPTPIAHQLHADDAVTAKPRPYRLSVSQYEAMIRSGVFGEKDSIFLWKGQLVESMTKGAKHNHTLSDLIAALVQLVPGGWHVRPDCSLIVGGYSMPEPGASIARGKTRDYPDKNPSAKDVSLVVEVSDSSVAVDSGDVLQAFAEAAIPVYWVVNIPAGTIDVYSTPSGPCESGIPHYADCHRFGPDDEVPLVLDGREVGRIAVKDVLP